MYLEPCCLSKQFNEMLDRITLSERNKSALQTAHFFSNSDWDLNDFLPQLVNSAPGGEVYVCLLTVEPSVLKTVRKLMERMTVDVATKQPIHLVSHLTLITQGDNRKDILTALTGFDDRLTIAEDNIGFRCVCTSNGIRRYVLHGSLNQEHSNATQMFTITTSTQAYEEVMEVLLAKARVKRIDDWETKFKRLNR